MPPRLGKTGLPSPRQSSFPNSQCRCARGSARAFSSTVHQQVEHEKRTKFRRQMFQWLNGPGAAFRDPLPGSTNYLGAYDDKGQLTRVTRAGDRKKKGGEDSPEGPLSEEDGGGERNLKGKKPLPKELADDMVPFPSNRAFSSQAVLADDLKNAIYSDMISGRFTVREASEKYNVTMERVGAVVRLKAIEAQWKEQNKPLATFYKDAVLAMLPTTALNSKQPHESINDLPVHQSTTPQIFYPAAESRRFTRRDAGEAFQEGLRPADQRIPHPEMIEMAKHSPEDLPQNLNERRSLLRERFRDLDQKKMRSDRRDEIEKLERTKVVGMGRWEYRFQDVTVDQSTVGHSPKGIGKRYGVPNQDRKKGTIKIPRTVE